MTQSAEIVWSQQLHDIPALLTQADCGPREALAAAQKLLPICEQLIMRDETTLQFAPGTSAESQEALLRKASMRVGLAFCVALHHADALINSKDHHDWSPYFGLHRRTVAHVEGNVSSAVERRLLNEYLEGRWNCHFMQLTGSAAAGLSPVSYDIFIYWSLQHIAEVSAHAGHPEHRHLALAMISLVTQHARQCSEQRDRRNYELRDQLLRSALISRDFNGLAHRSDEMIERYGDKNVEARFEEQLNILLQSLGFIVVGANRGQARVDFYCIAPLNDGQAYSILVEAKSSRAPYTLPAKYSRAILDYITATRNLLNTLPPLRAVLIVGQAPASTVEGKLASLQARAHLPVRYCSAAILGRLRDRLPGPAPLATFLASLHNGEPVLQDDAFHAVVLADQKERQAHIAFVDALMTRPQPLQAQEPRRTDPQLAPE